LRYKRDSSAVIFYIYFGDVNIVTENLASWNIIKPKSELSVDSQLCTVQQSKIPFEEGNYTGLPTTGWTDQGCKLAFLNLHTIFSILNNPILELLTVMFRSENMGTSLVGYLNHKSRNSILTPASVS
jgi:hypothetical protein